MRRIQAFLLACAYERISGILAYRLMRLEAVCISYQDVAKNKCSVVGNATERLYVIEGGVLWFLPKEAC